MGDFERGGLEQLIAHFNFVLNNIKMQFQKFFYLVPILIVLYLLVITLLPIVYSAQLFKTQPPKNSSPVELEINSNQVKTLNVAVIGDSTAIGQGTDSIQESFSYQYLLQSNSLRNLKIKYTNYAETGARIKDILDKQLIFEPVDLVFVSIGANDVTHLTAQKDFESSVASLTSKLQNLAKQVIWINIPDFISVPVFWPPLNYLTSNQAQKLNTITQKQVSKFNQIKIIDVYELARQPFLDNPDKYFSKDKFHPSKDGYQIWVDLITKAEG